MNSINANGLFIIGEGLSTHREEVQKAVSERDAQTILKILNRQQRNPLLTHVDVNTGAQPDPETEQMLWLLDTILPALKPDIGIVIDSRSAGCLSKALYRLKGRANTVVNAVYDSEVCYKVTIPLAAQHQADVIVLLDAEGEALGSVPRRMQSAEAVHHAMIEAGIPEKRHWYDPQILPIGADPRQPRIVLETLRELRQRYPSARLVAGLSNISFNLPHRKLLNRTYLAMLMSAGLDAVICDATDRQLRKAILAARAILGQDDFLADYLSGSV